MPKNHMSAKSNHLSEVGMFRGNYSVLDPINGCSRENLGKKAVGPNDVDTPKAKREDSKVKRFRS